MLVEGAQEVVFGDQFVMDHRVRRVGYGFSCCRRGSFKGAEQGGG